MEYRPDTGGAQPPLYNREAFQTDLISFINADPWDETVRTAFREAAEGHWGIIPATGLEWPSDSGQGGPQHVTLDVRTAFGGPLIAAEHFDDENIRDQLLCSGSVFAIVEDHNARTVWQPVHSQSQQWPVFRRFAVPGNIDGVTEIYPTDYAIAPGFRLPVMPATP